VITRRRFVLVGAPAAALVGLNGCTRETERTEVILSGQERTLTLGRRLEADEAPTSLDENASVVFRQVRGDKPAGDAMLVIRDEGEGEIYKSQSYFLDNGAYESGRWVTISQKRYGEDTPHLAGRIQAVSAVPDGREPFMIAVSPDVDGPALAAEAWTADTEGNRNCSAFAAYDLDAVHSGQTPNSPGYGRKKFVIRGDGGLWWGDDLGDNPFANSDVRIERVRPGHVRVMAPRQDAPAVLELEAAAPEASLRLSPAQGGVELSARAGGLEFVTGDSTDHPGIDASSAFRERVWDRAPGPPDEGAWTTGACVLNPTDSTMWWCIEGGTPGTWAGAALRKP